MMDRKNRLKFRAPPGHPSIANKAVGGPFPSTAGPGFIPMHQHASRCQRNHDSQPF